MSMPRVNLKRVVAALLPASLLWVFAACVSICGWELAASQGRLHFAPTVGVTDNEDAPDCEGCPDASLLKATTAERAKFEPALQAASDAAASISSVTSSADDVTFIPPYRPRLLADPPLNLLPALRI